MTTSFMLAKGYGFSASMNPSNDYMITTAKLITPDELYSKYIQLAGTEDFDPEELREMVDEYKSLPTEDLTCRFRTDEEGNIYIMQSASGGDRFVREKICRAFALLFLERAYKDNMAVSFLIG